MSLILLVIIVALAIFGALGWARWFRLRARCAEDAERLRRAVESDQAKTEFVSSVVHQFKSPLTALRWSVEMLETTVKDRKPEEAEALDLVVKVTGQLGRLVKSLLDTSRIESGRLKIEPKPTNLLKLADEAVGELKEEIDAKGQAVTVMAEVAPPPVNVDPILFCEVYKNLLSNAIKYTKSGGHIEVRIETRPGEVISSVRDNGYGIPAADQSHLFGMFYRASNAVQLEEGSGVGLHFVKQIVDVSGGRIWFESQEGLGTTFFFSLPTTIK